MKLLLLGAKGNLATAFNEVLKTQDAYEVIRWDKDELDITDRNLLEKKIKELRPAVIINTVAYNDVDRCETDPAARLLAEQLNVDTVRILGEISLEHDITLVHYSTDYVFAGDTVTAYAEDDEPAPRSVYGETKLKGERELIRLSGKGLRWYLIRTARLFGPKSPSAVAKPSFFELMLSLAKSQSEISAVDDERGCFTYTYDLARATLALLDNNAGYGIYHITNAGSASWYEAARYMFDRLGIAATLKPVAGDLFARPASRPKNSTLVSGKLAPLRSWQAAVDEYSKEL